MPIYKRCVRCGKRISSGSKCECLKERHKEYDKYSRDKVSDAFYHSKEWEIARADTISYFNEIDMYSYYVKETLEYGTTVHHIVPLKDDWDKRINKQNLIYLTDINHQQLHKAMREGQYEEIINLLNNIMKRYEKEFVLEGRGV